MPNVAACISLKVDDDDLAMGNCPSSGRLDLDDHVPIFDKVRLAYLPVA